MASLQTKECPICAEESNLFSINRCNHSICLRCSARTIFLYKNDKCLICKEKCEKPFFYKVSENKSYEELVKEYQKSKGESSKKDLIDSFANIKINQKVGAKGRQTLIEGRITCQDDKIFKIVSDLLSIKCRKCNTEFKTKKDLISHFKSHGAFLCETCLENNHEFWNEFKEYSAEDLLQHRKPENGGHFYCLFCKIFLYNRNLAKAHCIHTHQICMFCDVLGAKLQFFETFPSLEQHYKEAHYCCTDEACLRMHTFAFAYKSELWAHLIRHGITNSCIRSPQNKMNVPVFSLSEEPVERERKVEAFFPSFKEENERRAAAPSIRPGISSSQFIPDFLNRNNFTDIEKQKNQRKSIIKRFAKDFILEVEKAIEGFVSNQKGMDEMVQEIEICIGNEKTLSVLENCDFGAESKKIKEFCIKYKKQIKFPSFTRTEITKVEKKKSAFKILDVSEIRKKK